MTVGPRERFLVLLRHAKSAWPHGVPDRDRPLSGRGRRNAVAVGRWFTAEGPAPDLTLCSEAVRARHTWELVASVLPDPPRVRFEPDLYGADVDDLIDILHRVPDTVRSLVVVGHEPTLSGASAVLAGPGSDRTALSRIAEKYPTNGVALFRIAGSWSRVGPGAARLERFEVPRA